MTENRAQRLRGLRLRAVMAAARLKSHRTRCTTCARRSGLYDGLCVLGSSLQRELEAAQRVLAALNSPL